MCVIFLVKNLYYFFWAWTLHFQDLENTEIIKVVCCRLVAHADAIIDTRAQNC